MDHYTGGCLCGDVRIEAAGRPYRFARSGDDIEIHLAALDAPDQFKPGYENWIVRRESWLPPFPLAHHYQHNRETPGRFDEECAPGP